MNINVNKNIYKYLFINNKKNNKTQIKRKEKLIY